MVVEPGMKHSWYIFKVVTETNKEEIMIADMITLCDGSRMNPNTHFRKYLYRLRYDSVIDPKAIQQ